MFQNGVKNLTLIVPCYNEEKMIPEFLPRLIAFCEEHGFDLIVVDDGSVDRSPELLKSYQSECLRVLVHKENMGYGAAIKTGVFRAATKYVVTVDADGQHELDDVLVLLARAEQDRADMVVGERPAGSDASLYRRIGKGIIRGFAHMVMDTRIRDINSGMKLYRRDMALEFFPLCPDDMAFSDIILLFFISFRRRVAAENISVRPRTCGTSTIRTRTALATLWEIGQIIVLFHPFRFFGWIGGVIGITALIWEIRCFLLTAQISVGSSFALTFAAMMFFLGMITEHLCRLRKQSIRVWEWTDDEE